MVEFGGEFGECVENRSMSPPDLSPTQMEVDEDLSYISDDNNLEYKCRTNDIITRIREIRIKEVLDQRKLYLILDLDHTLANTIQTEDLTTDEAYLSSQADSIEGSLFILHSITGLMTKLRPFVKSFLKEASEMFEMYLYTLGDHNYAHEVAHLIDPEENYFWSERIISRTVGPEQFVKNLDMLQGQDRIALVLDDSQEAWRYFPFNFIPIEPYNYFSSSLKYFHLLGKSFAERMEDEEGDHLFRALLTLKSIHKRFFQGTQEEIYSKDVRDVWKGLQRVIQPNEGGSKKRRRSTMN